MNDAWIERWQIGRTGWHEPQGNASLKRYWDLTGRRVLVPLCGKSADLLWLESQGNSVTGVELSELDEARSAIRSLPSQPSSTRTSSSIPGRQAIDSRRSITTSR